MTKPKALKGLVLAGGESRRMGRDKAALAYPAFPGEPSAVRLGRLLAPFCDEVFVSRRPGQAGLPGMRRLDDREAGIGPAAALLAALAHAEVAWLVLACDFPFVNAAGLHSLLARRDASLAATYYVSRDGRPEPFFAIWEKAALAALREDVARGHASPRATLEKLSGRPVLATDPRILANVNSPEEARELGLL